jgi:hypothetical protein
MYLSEHNGCSQALAHFYLTNKGDKDFNNGAILNLVASIIKHVMSSVLEAELDWWPSTTDAKWSYLSALHSTKWVSTLNLKCLSQQTTSQHNKVSP